MERTAELKTITPDEARVFLEKNLHNRPLRTVTVKRYAAQMSAGEWRVTGDTIKIANTGIILDGQHRLHACLEADTPFQAYIVTDLDPEVFDVLDAGIPRRAPDALHIRGEVSVALLSAALGWVYRFENGTLSSASSKMSSHQALQLLDRHPGIREFVTRTNGTHQLAEVGRASITAACYYLFAKQDRKLADEFMKKLATGLKVEGDEPVYLLRERLLKERDRLGKFSPNYIIGLYFKAWNVTKEGKRMRQLGWKPDVEKFPDIGAIDSVHSATTGC